MGGQQTTLEPLQPDDQRVLVGRGLEALGTTAAPEAIDLLVARSGGDGRQVLTSLEVAAVSTAISLVLNLITPSAPERRIWAPVAAVLLVTSLTVALTAPPG